MNLICSNERMKVASDTNKVNKVRTEFGEPISLVLSWVLGQLLMFVGLSLVPFHHWNPLDSCGFGVWNSPTPMRSTQGDSDYDICI
jgi:hypothetical protein